MLSRRTLIGSTAVLAAGCGGLEIPFPEFGTPTITPLTWISRPVPNLNTGPGMTTFRQQLQRVERSLAEDTESPIGPTRGRYSLTLEYFETYAGSYSDPESVHFLSPKHLAEWLKEVGADLITLWRDEVRALEKHGVLMPLDQFGGVNGENFEREFFTPVLKPYRESGTLYALPLNAFPMMLYYDADYFAQVGVPPPDGSWDWDVLVENALKLTQRNEDGTVKRWGLDSHGEAIWWALWQNEAEMADALTSQCRLQESPALEAIEFVRGLIHSHRVSPPVLGTDRFDLLYNSSSPPAMVYSTFPLDLIHFNYRRAVLPTGKVRQIPVETFPGIAIVAETAAPEAAYAALRGLVRSFQPFANVPVEKESMGRIGKMRRDLRQEEVAAMQHSMELGRLLPEGEAQRSAMRSMLAALVRGDDVAAVVNQGCAALYGA